MEFNWLSDIHLYLSQLNDGQMSFKNGNREEVVNNRVKFLSRYNLRLEDVVGGELVHGTNVAFVSSQDKGRGAFDKDWIPGVDGLITRDPGVILMTTHKDCIPLVLYDAKNRIIGQSHIGWRGLAFGIVGKMIQAVRQHGGSSVQEIKVWIGPAIRVCCYPVGPEVASLFPSTCLIRFNDHWHLDMVRFLKEELFRWGITPDNIWDTQICTSCTSTLSSHRRDGVQAPAMALVSGIKDYKSS